MKLTLLLLASLITGMAFSQGLIPYPQKKSPYSFKRIDIPKLESLNNSNKPVPTFTESLPVPEAKYRGTLPNGNLAFALPQDNMPCVVPNENATVPMPNVSIMPTLPYQYMGPGAIPNPAVPILIKKPKKK